MNIDETTVAYDNALLSKERSIKRAKILLLVLFLLYVIPSIYLIGIQSSVGDTSPPILQQYFVISLLFVLLARINDLHLKHIASIKTYRKET